MHFILIIRGVRGEIMKTYLRHKILNVVDIKGLTALEYLDFEGKYRQYTESHDFWELCFVEEGEITLISKENQQRLIKNEIVLIPPNTTHSYISNNGNKNRAFVICFESFSHSLKVLSQIKFLLSDLQLNCINTVISESKNTFKMNDKDLLEVLPSPNFAGQQVILLNLEYLFITLIRQLSLEKNSEIVFLNKEKFYQDLTEIIIGYFAKNLNKKLSLDDICKKFNYSRSFLCKKFKEVTGETLIGAFNRMKIEEAKKMLLETNASISDISYSLGFGEVKYFDYLFKKYIGVSPTKLRESKRG